MKHNYIFEGLIKLGFQFIDKDNDNIVIDSTNANIGMCTGDSIERSCNLKLYAEFFIEQGKVFVIGLGNEKWTSINSYDSNFVGFYLYNNTIFPRETSYNLSASYGGYLGILIDIANDSLQFSFNGTIGDRLSLTNYLGEYENLRFMILNATNNPNALVRANFGDNDFKYLPSGYMAANNISLMYLINKNDHLYNINDDKYNIISKSYDNITISSNDTIKDVYVNNTIILSNLFVEKNINGETFIPIEKFYPFRINMLKINKTK